LADFSKQSRENYANHQPQLYHDDSDTMKQQTIDIPTWTFALSIRASRNVPQNAVLADAVTILVFVRAIDGSNGCRVAAFLLIVSSHSDIILGANDLERTIHAGIRAACGPVCAKESTAIDSSKNEENVLRKLAISVIRPDSKSMIYLLGPTREMHRRLKRVGT
jgi:hypothetical protein